MKEIKLIRIILLCFISSVLFGQDNLLNRISFKHLGIEEGLSQSTVTSIIQDQKGYLWFGTANGLNRYDGYTFKVFTNNPLDSTTISDNGTRALYEDKYGYIWIGTIEGILNRYDRKSGTFDKIDLTKDVQTETKPGDSDYNFPVPLSRNNRNTITCITEDKKNNIWIGTWGNGLFQYNPRTKKIIRYSNNPEEKNGFRSNRVNSILVDTDKVIWIATLGDGLFKMFLNDNDEEVRLVNYKTSADAQSISNNRTYSLYKDNAGNLWIGTFGGGLNMLSRRYQQSESNKAKFIRYKFQQGTNNSLSSNIITSIIEDNSGNLWIGTFNGGVNLLNKKTGQIRNFKNNPYNPNSISKNDVLCVFKDRSGNIWIGTSLGAGLDKIEYREDKFNRLFKEIDGNTGLNDNIVWSLKADQRKLWIGTNSGGLNIWDRTNGKFSYIKANLNNPNSLSDNQIRTIVEDRFNNLWLGTYSGGVNVLNKSTLHVKRLEHITGDTTSLGSNQVQSILIDKDGDYWIGTFGGGLNKLTKENFLSGNYVFKKYNYNSANPFSLSNNRIYTMYQDKTGIIWIGTFGGGLNKFDKEKETFISYKNLTGDESSLSENRIMTIYEDSNNNLWIGTYGGGLNLFDRKKESFTRFNDKNRFKNSVVYGILEDDYNHLWISSDNGLLKFDIPTHQVTQYDLNDGLQSQEFSGGAYYKSPDGEMFFGGINGINYFYPDKIFDNQFVPPIVIASVNILNNTIPQEVDSLQIEFDQNFFSFEFAALDYTDPMDNQYAYMLEGFDKEWHFVNARMRIASYTNLAPGKYVFSVIGSNNDGVWNYDGKNIRIEILPPFWRRWWFISGSIIVLLLIIYSLVTAKYRSLLAIEKIKTKLSADLHDNVGSGLTEISILSELASYEVKTLTGSDSTNLSAISEKARHLIDSMSDIVWMVNPKRDSFHDLIVRLKDSYAELMNSSGISFRTQNLEKIQNLKLPMEYKYNLFLIFKEGLNNAIKHSKCNRITLEVNHSKEVLELVLQDDGRGIDQGKIESGNGIRNMKTRARHIGGVLEITSSDNGTIIKFREKKNGVNKLFSLFARNN